MKQWTDLISIDQLAVIRAESYEIPVVIFKHSTSCGISMSAKHKLEFEVPDYSLDWSFYFLDLLRYRSVSHAVAEEFRVIHQSPQIIVIRDGQSIFDASHHKVTPSAIKIALQTEPNQ